MLRLLINLWIMLGIVGSVILAMMVFAFILVLFQIMMERIRK